MKLFSDVTKAAYDAIKTHKPVLVGGYTVERSAPVNEDWDLCPWVGVYRGTTPITPATAGAHKRSWSAAFPLRIVVQASHGGCPEACEDLLDEYVANVLDALDPVKKINGTVDRVKNISIEYLYKETDSSTLYFQWAVITINTEIRTGFV